VADFSAQSTTVFGPLATPSTVSNHYVYILRCADDTLYTGYTADPERRLGEHNAGEGAKYTRGRTPVELVYLESYDTQSAAMSREYKIKQLRRSEKRRLVKDSAITGYGH